jgi:hypothetical protein
MRAKIIILLFIGLLAIKVKAQNTIEVVVNTPYSFSAPQISGPAITSWDWQIAGVSKGSSATFTYTWTVVGGSTISITANTAAGCPAVKTNPVDVKADVNSLSNSASFGVPAGLDFCPGVNFTLPIKLKNAPIAANWIVTYVTVVGGVSSVNKTANVSGQNANLTLNLPAGLYDVKIKSIIVDGKVLPSAVGSEPVISGISVASPVIDDIQ